MKGKFAYNELREIKEYTFLLNDITSKYLNKIRMT